MAALIQAVIFRRKIANALSKNLRDFTRRMIEKNTMRVIQHGVIYLVGELAARSVPFLLLPYLSRKLGVEGFGELSYFQTYMALFAIVIGLSQDGAITRYFYFHGPRSLNLVVRASYAYSTVMFALILAVCWYLKSEILAYVAFATLFQSFLSVQLGLRQCQQQVGPYALIQFCSAVLSALLTIILMELFDSALVEKRMLAILLSNAVVWICAHMIFRQQTRIRPFNLYQYKIALLYLLGFGLPLVLHQASWFLRGQLDRIFIYHQFSQADLGLYAMGVQIAGILTILIQALNKAFVPHFYGALKIGAISLKHIHRWAFLSLLIVPLPALVMWIIPEGLITWLLGEQFKDTKYYIVLFLFSFALMIPYLILVNYLFYHGKNKFISFCSVLTTVVYVVSLIYLSNTSIEYVPYASLIGAVVILPILYFMTIRVSKSV